MNEWLAFYTLVALACAALFGYFSVGDKEAGLEPMWAALFWPVFIATLLGHAIGRARR